MSVCVSRMRPAFLNGNLIRIACQAENKVEIEIIYFPLKSNGIRL